MRVHQKISGSPSRLRGVIAATTLLLGVVACGGGGDEPTAPPAQTTGTLSVTADQSTCGTITWSAEVFINGASQGRRQLGPFNPLSFTLQAGQHSVSVQLTDGTRTYTSAPVSTQILVGQSTNRIITCL
ncbi:MAG: hypothetical protein IT353_15230 [Gemmatimonadaceae bacterium]|nr:hypothetical protein [Gemmatimonadaceae bacterium]